MGREGTGGAGFSGALVVAVAQMQAPLLGLAGHVSALGSEEGAVPLRRVLYLW